MVSLNFLGIASSSNPLPYLRAWQTNEVNRIVVKSDVIVFYGKMFESTGRKSHISNDYIDKVLNPEGKVR